MGRSKKLERKLETEMPSSKKNKYIVPTTGKIVACLNHYREASGPGLSKEEEKTKFNGRYPTMWAFWIIEK